MNAYVPPEILRHILSYLPHPSCSRVSRSFHEIEESLKNERCLRCKEDYDNDGEPAYFLAPSSDLQGLIDLPECEKICMRNIIFLYKNGILGPNVIVSSTLALDISDYNKHSIENLTSVVKECAHLSDLLRKAYQKKGKIKFLLA